MCNLATVVTYGHNGVTFFAPTVNHPAFGVYNLLTRGR